MKKVIPGYSWSLEENNQERRLSYQWGRVWSSEACEELMFELRPEERASAKPVAGKRPSGPGRDGSRWLSIVSRGVSPR